MSASAVPGAPPPVPGHRGCRTHQWRSSQGPPGRSQRIAAGVRPLVACRSPRQCRRRGWASSPQAGTPMAGRNHLDSLDGPNLRTHAGFTLLVPGSPPQKFSNLPSLGEYNRAQQAYRQRCGSVARSSPGGEPHCGWRANGAAVVKCEPLAIDCGGFGLWRSFTPASRSAMSCAPRCSIPSPATRIAQAT